MDHRHHDLVCFSHLRWSDLHARPHHLMRRAARDRRVFFVEEPVFDGQRAELSITRTPEGIVVVVPVLPADPHGAIAQRPMLDELLDEHLGDALLWYTTPAALDWTSPRRGRAVIYDALDSAVDGQRERHMLRLADLVFTAGHGLREHLRRQHREVYLCPSSVDATHFAIAAPEEPADLRGLVGRRVGFHGSIDARIDLALLDELARLRPDLALVMLGPTDGLDRAALPQRPNLHWLGAKSYDELPGYLAALDVAMAPYAIGAATRFTTPVNMLECLAAGLPVVATPIAETVRPYGHLGLARIAGGAAAFAAAIDEVCAAGRAEHQARAAAFLAGMSWDATWAEIWAHLERAARLPVAPPAARGRGERRARPAPPRAHA